MTNSTENSPSKDSSWVEFWNQSNSIYANPRHLEAHYNLVAQCVIRAAQPGKVVMDYGCGDALASHLVAAKSQHLYLFDAAPQKQQQLAARFASVANITVLNDQSLTELPDKAVDCVVINSVFQYLNENDAQTAWPGNCERRPGLAEIWLGRRIFCGGCGQLGQNPVFRLHRDA
jgi:ubiquinone/menaquinone biosynthesis C-methylase UbiE